MQSTQPITSAVYGRKHGGSKPRTQREQPRRAERLVGRMLGEETVAALYADLGFKPPEERRKRGGRS